MMISDYLQQIIDNPWAAALVILNLILIESLLSIDNAAVLATMVMDLPKHQRNKALKYGIFGAYFFRGVCLIFAAILIKIWWLKILGGLYLIYLFVSWWHGKNTPQKEDDVITKESSWFYKATVGALGTFWSTVVLVEIMDLTFSIDNVFAAVAYSENLILIWTGVFIGILAMRFVAQFFIELMEKYHFLETCAFIVIAILGVKLTLSGFEHFYPEHPFSKFLVSHTADYITSGLTISIFLVPILTSIFFNFPKKTIASKTAENDSSLPS